MSFTVHQGPGHQTMKNTGFHLQKTMFLGVTGKTAGFGMGHGCGAPGKVRPPVVPACAT